MEIRVSGHQMATGSALQEHATDRLNAISEKFFSRALSSAVTFGKAPAGAFSCDIVLHVNQGLILKSHGQAQDAHQAFEQAAGKVEKQLRRYKRRLKDRHAARQNGAGTIEAPSYVIEAPDTEDEVSELNPVIIAESTTVLMQLSVSEAVMELDLTGAPVVVFRHASHGRVNLVYRRPDGNVGWIDPPAAAH